MQIVFSGDNLYDVKYFPENRLWHPMQIFSLGDNLYEVRAYFLGKNKSIRLLSAEFAHSVVKATWNIRPCFQEKMHASVLF